MPITLQFISQNDEGLCSGPHDKLQREPDGHDRGFAPEHHDSTITPTSVSDSPTSPRPTFRTRFARNEPHNLQNRRRPCSHRDSFQKVFHSSSATSLPVTFHVGRAIAQLLSPGWMNEVAPQGLTTPTSSRNSRSEPISSLVILPPTASSHRRTHRHRYHRFYRSRSHFPLPRRYCRHPVLQPPVPHLTFPALASRCSSKEPETRYPI